MTRAIDSAPPSPEPLSAPLAAKLRSVDASLHRLESVLVALSGGADSALLCALAHAALGDRAAAGMGLSAAYPAAEVDSARALTERLGMRLLVAETHQLDDERFLRNDSQRCYFCRDEMYGQLRELARSNGLAELCDGAIADDAGEHRPGRRAAREAGVRSPLAEAGITKAEVRQASRRLGLPTWDKPQQACLSSRIPRGTPITVAALRRVEQAEALLRAEGFRQNRVREHGGCARIEVEAHDLARFAEPGLRDRLVGALRALGYAFVSLDLEGFASGKLNRLVPGAELEVERSADR